MEEPIPAKSLVPDEVLIRMYVIDKLPSTVIGPRVGMHPGTVRAKLRRLGLTRSIRDANILSAAAATPEARGARAAAAHDAVRGVVRSDRELYRRSQSHWKYRDHVGPHEVTFCGLLKERGILFEQQYAIDIYNVDVALTEHRIAVEVVAGSGNARVAANAPQRLELIRNRGWHMFEIRFGVNANGGRTWGMGVVDELVAFMQETSPDPAARGQYRVVRPDGRAVRTYVKRQRRAVVPGSDELPGAPVEP